MKRKIKSYSLIEILIASMIFMVVAIFGASSFAMITKSNNTTEDFQVATQCSNQIESYIKNVFETADKGERIFGLLTVSAPDHTYKLAKLSFDTPPATLNKKMVGFVAVSNTKQRVVFASINSGEKYGRYYQKDINLTDAQLINNFQVDLTGASIIHNNQCAATMDTAAGADDTLKFRIERTKNNTTNSMVYRLSVSDKIFPSAINDRTNAISTGNYIGINIRALNAIKKI